MMEYEMKVQLEEEYKQSPEKMIYLEIPDIYSKNDPWLIKLLKDKLYEHFKNQGFLF